jgi:hypothetical protein
MQSATLSQRITPVILGLRAEYIADAYAPSYFEINNGLCDEFGEEVVARLAVEDRASVFTVEGLNFMDEDEKWDTGLLRKHWNIKPPEQLTWDMLNEIPFGCHIWVTDGTLHYDAEQPAGVASFFDLPIFRRYIISYLREKGIVCPDVETDDVVPAPLCDVPNPVEAVEAL